MIICALFLISLKITFPKWEFSNSKILLFYDFFFNINDLRMYGFGKQRDSYKIGLKALLHK